MAVCHLRPVGAPDDRSGRLGLIHSSPCRNLCGKDGTRLHFTVQSRTAVSKRSGSPTDPWCRRPTKCGLSQGYRFAQNSSFRGAPPPALAGSVGDRSSAIATPDGSAYAAIRPRRQAARSSVAQKPVATTARVLHLCNQISKSRSCIGSDPVVAEVKSTLDTPLPSKRLAAI